MSQVPVTTSNLLEVNPTASSSSSSSSSSSGDRGDDKSDKPILKFLTTSPDGEAIELKYDPNSKKSVPDYTFELSKNKNVMATGGLRKNLRTKQADRIGASLAPDLTQRSLHSINIGQRLAILAICLDNRVKFGKENPGGSTLVTATLTPKGIVFGNIGDSYLDVYEVYEDGTSSYDRITSSHEAKDANEKERVEKAGFSYSASGADFTSPAGVEKYKCVRVYRSLSDTDAEPSGVAHTPEVGVYQSKNPTKKVKTRIVRLNSDGDPSGETNKVIFDTNLIPYSSAKIINLTKELLNKSLTDNNSCLLAEHSSAMDTGIILVLADGHAFNDCEIADAAVRDLPALQTLYTLQYDDLSSDEQKEVENKLEKLRHIDLEAGSWEKWATYGNVLVTTLRELKGRVNHTDFTSLYQKNFEQAQVAKINSEIERLKKINISKMYPLQLLGEHLQALYELKSNGNDVVQNLAYEFAELTAQHIPHDFYAFKGPIPIFVKRFAAILEHAKQIGLSSHAISDCVIALEQTFDGSDYATTKKVILDVRFGYSHGTSIKPLNVAAYYPMLGIDRDKEFIFYTIRKLERFNYSVFKEIASQLKILVEHAQQDNTAFPLTLNLINLLSNISLGPVAQNDSKEATKTLFPEKISPNEFRRQLIEIIAKLHELKDYSADGLHSALSKAFNIPPPQTLDQSCLAEANRLDSFISFWDKLDYFKVFFEFSQKQPELRELIVDFLKETRIQFDDRRQIDMTKRKNLDDKLNKFLEPKIIALFTPKMARIFWNCCKELSQLRRPPLDAYDIKPFVCLGKQSENLEIAQYFLDNAVTLFSPAEIHSAIADLLRACKLHLKTMSDKTLVNFIYDLCGKLLEKYPKFDLDCALQCKSICEEKTIATIALPNIAKALANVVNKLNFFCMRQAASVAKDSASASSPNTPPIPERLSTVSTSSSKKAGEDSPSPTLSSSTTPSIASRGSHQIS